MKEKKYITFIEIFKLRWMKVGTNEYAESYWENVNTNFLLWLDQTEWLWKIGVLKGGNWLYRHTFGPERCKDCFNHMHDYHELCSRVYALEQELKELKGEETSESWKRRREEEDRKRSEELIKMGPGPDLSETITTSTGHW